MERIASIERNTNETQIQLTLDVDGNGQSNLETGVPFMTHMLDLFTKHGQFNLTVDAKGDIEVDDHHN
jgi:imidazoleglycerol-phosphate dehydratase